jgi:hypothetical protein
MESEVPKDFMPIPLTPDTRNGRKMVCADQEQHFKMPQENTTQAGA